MAKNRPENPMLRPKRWAYAREGLRSLNHPISRILLFPFLIIFSMLLLAVYQKLRLIRDFDPQMFIYNPGCFEVLEGLEPLVYHQDGAYAAVMAKEVVLTEDCEATLLQSEGGIDCYALNRGYMTILREPDGVVLFYHAEKMENSDILRLVRNR